MQLHSYNGRVRKSIRIPVLIHVKEEYEKEKRELLAELIYKIYLRLRNKRKK